MGRIAVGQRAVNLIRQHQQVVLFTTSATASRWERRMTPPVGLLG